MLHLSIIFLFLGGFELSTVLKINIEYIIIENGDCFRKWVV